MFRRILHLIHEEFRPYAALNAVAQVASYHRIQCSPGFRNAAKSIQQILSADNVAVEVLQFPAKEGGGAFWSQESFPEWDCRDAELVLFEDGKGERLCSFAEHPISVIQRSAATPPEGIHTSIVYIEKGTEESSYEGKDVAGKLVFSRGNVTEIAKLAVDKYKAQGILVDNMAEFPGTRDRFTLPDGRQYQSFWPSKPEKHKAFGFMLSPRQGEALRKQFSEGKRELKAYARVDSSFADGYMEIVQATIPGVPNEKGEAAEEVIAMAHLCHPQPSANDNASGCGALMEAVRTLRRLIDSGRLPNPKRTIRFLWLPEISGSYAYLASREADLGRFVAAINLDMVGQNQDLCGSTFILERPVFALPGFGGDLARSILRLITKQVSNLGASHAYSTFRWTVSPYSGGSDHYVWGDPSVGVTCPMIIQWPDRYYHTSEDTMDKVDPDMLKVSGVLAATYVYVAATANPAEAVFLAGEMVTSLAEEIEDALVHLWEKWHGILSDTSHAHGVSKVRRALTRRIDFLCERRAENVRSLSRLAGDSTLLEKAVQSALSAIESVREFVTEKHLQNLVAIAKCGSSSELPLSWQEPDSNLWKRAQGIVPRRRFKGPFSTMAKESPPGYDEALKSFKERHKDIRVPSTLIEYWADGKRTLSDIADIIEGETGFYNLEALLDYYDIMVIRGVFQK